MTMVRHKEALLFPEEQTGGQSYKAAGLFFGFLLISGIFWTLQNVKSSFSWFSPKVYEFGGETSFANSGDKLTDWNLNSIEDVVKTIALKTTNKQGTYGWYVAGLQNEEEFGENEDKAYTAASVNKVPIMVTFLLAVENGEQDLAKSYKLTSEDIVEGTGSIQYEKIGSSFTYEELLMVCGKNSDNTAAKILMDRVTEKKVQAFVDEVVMDKTDIEENLSSPKDMARLFKAIFQDKVFAEIKSKDLFFDALSDTDFEDRISKGVPSSTRVIHKIGNEIQVWNDCGIVLSNKPYAVCVLTDGIRQAEAEEILPFISEVVWEYMDR